MLKSLAERRAKYARKITKFYRPKHSWRTFPDSMMDAKFKEKSQKYTLKTQKASKLVQRILVYESYSRFSLDNDPNFWWQEMTGKPPTSFTPSLRTWHEKQQSKSLSLIWYEDYQRSKETAAKTHYMEDDLGYMS